MQSKYPFWGYAARCTTCTETPMDSKAFESPDQLPDNGEALCSLPARLLVVGSKPALRRTGQTIRHGILNRRAFFRGALIQDQLLISTKEILLPSDILPSQPFGFVGIAASHGCEHTSHLGQADFETSAQDQRPADDVAAAHVDAVEHRAQGGIAGGAAYPLDQTVDRLQLSPVVASADDLLHR